MQDEVLDVVVNANVEVEKLESLLLVDEGAKEAELEALVPLRGKDEVVELTMLAVFDEDVNFGVTDVVELNFEETGDVAEVLELSLEDTKTELGTDFGKIDEAKLEVTATKELSLVELTFTADDEDVTALEGAF